MCKEYINIQTGEKLDLERVASLPDNAMLKVEPELWEIWDFEKNEEYDIWKMTYGVRKKAWWICRKCESNYDCRIDHKVRGVDCSYCKGFKVNHTNCLATINPQLASEWHPIKNANLTPHDFTKGNESLVWWLGICGHEWKASVAKRMKNKGCPYCAKRKVSKGLNDMWTTNPIKASWLLNPEDGYKYSDKSSVKLKWKCPSCEEFVAERTASNMDNINPYCNVCKDNISLCEKMMSLVLRESGVEFKHDTSFEWSNKKRYDFYIPFLDMIIETHGRQHYSDGFSHKKARTVQQEQENDKYKKKLALENGIKKYIVINCKQNNFSYIKNNIIKSELSNYFDLKNVRWQLTYEKSEERERIDEVVKMWESGLSLKEMMKYLDVSRSKLNKIFNIIKELKLTDCSEKEARKRGNNSGNKISVIQLSLNNDFINEYSSLTKASIATGISRYFIGKVLKKEIDFFDGYKWMYKKDYDKYISEK